MNFAAQYNPNTDLVTREFYFNVGGEHVVMYLFLFLSVAFFAFSIYRKAKVWKLGKAELRTDRPVRRIIAVVKYAGLQLKVFREKIAGLMHGAVFFGFLGLVAVTAILTIQDDITLPLFKLKYLSGSLYLFWSLFADIMGALVLVGLAVAIVRRYIVRPARLDTKPADTVLLVLLFVVIVTGFLAEAIRIALTGMPAFEVWSPVGYAMAGLFTGIDLAALRNIHYADWWVHMSASFLCVALLGTGKIGHIALSALNIFFMNLDNESAETKYALKTIDPGEFETAESFGVSKIEEFTWKQLMDGDACTRCGRCQDNCPAHLTEKPLSPKKMINDIKATMDQTAAMLANAEDPSGAERAPLIGGAVSCDEFWSCTNCGACMEACPVNIEHVQKMIDMRRHQVLMQGDMAPELQTAFQNMENNANPYGFGFAGRGAWITEVPGLVTLAEDPNVDYLYFVGCAASYDRRNQKVAAALVKILMNAGIKVGILGQEEACCGDAAMRGGNEYLFQSLAARNLETFKSYGVKRIIVTCPHGYNVLKKEYRKFAATAKGSDGAPLEYDFTVYHHTEVLLELLSSGRIQLKEALNAKIAFHDSCFLGRYNRIYDEPRTIISAIPGAKLVEMDRARDTGFCCGAGGARMFMEEHLGTRINQSRTKDAKASGASMVCTACPFCMTMLSDGATELGMDDLKTCDVAEFVYESMVKL